MKLWIPTVKLVDNIFCEDQDDTYMYMKGYHSIDICFGIWKFVVAFINLHGQIKRKHFCFFFQKVIIMKIIIFNFPRGPFPWNILQIVAEISINVLI